MSQYQMMKSDKRHNEIFAPSRGRGTNMKKAVFTACETASLLSRQIFIIPTANPYFCNH